MDYLDIQQYGESYGTHSVYHIDVIYFFFSFSTSILIHVTFFPGVVANKNVT